jgi:hypothetical protein
VHRGEHGTVGRAPAGADAGSRPGRGVASAQVAARRSDVIIAAPTPRMRVLMTHAVAPRSSSGPLQRAEARRLEQNSLKSMAYN